MTLKADWSDLLYTDFQLTPECEALLGRESDDVGVACIRFCIINEECGVSYILCKFRNGN